MLSLLDSVLATDNVICGNSCDWSCEQLDSLEHVVQALAGLRIAFQCTALCSTQKSLMLACYVSAGQKSAMCPHKRSAKCITGIKLSPRKVTVVASTTETLRQLQHRCNSHADVVCRHFAHFAAVVAEAPGQCLRYCFDEGAEPLWSSPQHTPTPQDIPPCQHCGTSRRFEFQVINLALPVAMCIWNTNHCIPHAVCLWRSAALC